MIGLVTAVLAGSAAGLPTAVLSDHLLLAAIIADVLVVAAVFPAMIHIQVSTWRQAAARLLADE